MTIEPIRSKEEHEEYLKLSGQEELQYIDIKTNSILLEKGVSISNCICCNHELTSPIFSGYQRCDNCFTLNSNPRIQYEAQKMLSTSGSAQEFFHQNVYKKSISRRKEIMTERLSRISNYIKKGNLLDIGCASGLFLDVAFEHGFTTSGVEVLDYCVKEVTKKGHIVYKGFFEEIQLFENTYDIITAWDVIAHINYLDIFLKKIYILLKPLGILCMTTPNSLSLEYDNIWEDGIIRHNNLKPHIFLQIFSFQSIKCFLENNGFNVIEINTTGTMDIENLRDQSFRQNKRFNSLFFNDVILNNSENGDKRRKNFQNFLTDNNFSGNIFLIAKKK